MRTESTFTLKIDCTACLISVLVASLRYLEHQRVLVFFNGQAFFGDHRTAKNLICGFHYATSAAFSCASAAAESSPPSRLRASPHAAAAKPTSSASPAASQCAGCEKIAPGRSAAGDRDELRFRAPVRPLPGCANSIPDCGFRACHLHQQHRAFDFQLVQRLAERLGLRLFQFEVFTTISLPSANFAASAERNAPSSFLRGKV